MSHTTTTRAAVQIVRQFVEITDWPQSAIGKQVTLTQHWHGTYVDARTYVARYLADNGLSRNSYSDSETLFCDGVAVGHYTITRS